ncbi:aspartyl protease family protein [uncultured Tenacibaculum sp.]|uniref:retropepsin-like aspartic protease n=1 Tax=uncultured Tenacibaculum sp. TaxID=174713 RepID=UPI0026206A2D|nr:aspartyl protease family protein [uncultured Tenacibaculum sp.]
MIKKILTLLVLHFCFASFGQGKFHFIGKNSDKQEVNFRLINNLIIMPLEINGKELSFILDTGVNKTILFNLTQSDSIGLNEIKKVYIYGLGDGEPVEALQSRKNTFRVKGLVNTNESLYVILKDAFNVSARMGTTIHGILGYDLLKDVIAKVDYSNRKITFYNPKTYKYPKRKCRKCEVLPLQFYRNKPYVDVKVDLINGLKDVPTKLLIDSGGSDAVWLFENSREEILTPEKYFDDILGEGFSGTIYGKRSRISKLKLGKFELIEPTTSFLDSVSTFNARKFKKRNGSIGGEVLKRFKLWVDYPNKKMTLKKAGSLKKGFYYNMSGLQVVYNGQELIKEEAISKFTDNYGTESRKNNTLSLVTTYFYRFKPSYKIDKVVPGSPAERAGLMEGDVIKYLNGKPAHTYSLSDIVAIFHSRPDRKVRMKVERGVTPLKFEFKLEKRI